MIYKSKCLGGYVDEVDVASSGVVYMCLGQSFTKLKWKKRDVHNQDELSAASLRVIWAADTNHFNSCLVCNIIILSGEMLFQFSSLGNMRTEVRSLKPCQRKTKIQIVS